jgi:hypothetical protein
MSPSSPRRTDDALTVIFDEAVDAAAAGRARELLASASKEPIVLDFTRARDVDWHALATLTRTLAGQPAGRVEVRGLCDHHLRLLRYLEAGPQAPAGSSPRAERGLRA